MDIVYAIVIALTTSIATLFGKDIWESIKRSHAWSGIQLGWRRSATDPNRILLTIENNSSVTIDDCIPYLSVEYNYEDVAEGDVNMTNAHRVDNIATGPINQVRLLWISDLAADWKPIPSIKFHPGQMHLLNIANLPTDYVTWTEEMRVQKAHRITIPQAWSVQDPIIVLKAEKQYIARLKLVSATHQPKVFEFKLDASDQHCIVKDIVVVHPNRCWSD